MNSDKEAKTDKSSLRSVALNVFGHALNFCKFLIKFRAPLKTGIPQHKFLIQ